MSPNECLISLLNKWLTHTSLLFKLDLQYHQQMGKKCDILRFMSRKAKILRRTVRLLEERDHCYIFVYMYLFEVKWSV